jgi:hypothetical protein
LKSLLFDRWSFERDRQEIVIGFTQSNRQNAWSSLVSDHSDQQADFNVTADNGRAWQLDMIAEANRKLKTQAASKVH